MITFEKIDEYRLAFSLYDKDGDGLISIEEFRTLMKTLEVENNQSDENLILQFNAYGSNAINFEEFLEIMVNQVNFSNNEALRDAFKVFDKDGNGYISAAELKHVMLSLGENITDEEIDEMIKEADLDGDGQINYDGRFIKTKKKSS